MRSVQSSLLFLYYVVFSVMSVQYYLCVSRIQCTQCSVSVYRVGSVLQRSMQVVLVSVQFLKYVQFIGQSVAYIVNGVRCQLGYSLRRSWSAYYYSVLVVFSLVFSCQWGSESVAVSVSSVQGVYCSVGHSPSVLFSVCSVQSTGCNQESVMLMSCSESTL